MDAARTTADRRSVGWRKATALTGGRRKIGWRGVLGVVSLFVFPGIVVPQGTASSVGESFRASVTQDWVEGHNWTAGATATVWVDDSGGSMKGSTTTVVAPDGSFRVERDQLGVDIVFGDEVVVTDPGAGHSAVMTGPLSIDVVRDPAAAFGTLPSGATVQVYVNGSACESSASVADGDDGTVDGNWSYDFGGACPGGLGFFERGEVDFGWTVAQSPLLFQIGASLDEEWIYGTGFAPFGSADVWVNADPLTQPPTFTTPLDFLGRFTVDSGLDLQSGDAITVDDGAMNKSMILSGPLSVFVDPATPFVYGELPVGEGVQTWAWGSDCNPGAFVLDGDDGAVDGLWSKDFSADCPTGLGTDRGAVALHFDPFDDFTQVRAAPPPQIRASVTNLWVEGEGLVPGGTVDLWINADPLTEPPTYTLGLDGDGNFWQEHPVVFGDLIIADDGTNYRELLLEGPLSIDADLAARTASGELPFGATVRVEMGGEDCGTGTDVADGDDGTVDGLWSVDLSGDCTGGLGPNPGAQVKLFDVDGDATVAEPPPPPEIQANPMYDWIAGHGLAPSTIVDIWVNADPLTQPPTDSVGTDPGGHFHFNPSVDLMFGDLIIADDGVNYRELLLEGPLSIQVDGPSATAWGELPLGAIVHVEIGGQDCGAGRDVHDGDDGTVDGLWFVNLIGECTGGLGPDAGGQAFLYDVDGDATVAEPPQPPQIRVSETGNWMEGQGFAPNSPIDIWVNADPALDPPTEGTGTDPNGNFHFGFDVDLVFGDYVAASDGIILRELVLEGPLSINADLDLLLADGELPVGADVQVDMNGQDCGAAAMVADSDDGTVDGLWSTDLSGQCPGGLGPDAGAQVQLFDVDGDATVAEPPQPPQIRVSETGNWMEGQGFAPNSPVELWVNADPALDPPTEVVGSDPGGYINWGFDFDLVFGDYVAASDGIILRELVLEGPLSINADLDLLLADGELPIGADVGVEMWGNDCHTERPVADGDDGTVDGLWSADLSGDCPGGLGPNAWARVKLYDVDGDATIAEPPPVPQIRVSETGNWMDGHGFAPDAAIDLWVNADPLTQPPTEGAGSDPHGNFHFGFGIDLVFGDYVAASDGIILRELVLEGPLSMNADFDLIVADGELPIGADVRVEMFGQDCYASQPVADGDDGTVDGLWSADLSGQCPGGLGADAWGRVGLADVDGDETLAEPPQQPQLWVSENRHYIEGFGFAPNASIDIWVNADPATEPPNWGAGTDPGGNFNTTPPFDIAFGDLVAASDGVIMRDLVVTGPLSIDADLAAMTAAGELPVFGEIDVEMQGDDCGAQLGVTDGDDGTFDGLWSADLSGQCPGGLGGNAWARVFLPEPDGDATISDFMQPRIWVSETRDDVEGFDFAPNGSVDIWINADPVSDPPFDTFGTDHGGNFHYGFGFDLIFGDLVIVSDGSTQRELVLEAPLSIAADFGAVTAAGELPFGAAVDVEMNGNDCGAWTGVADGDDGTVDGLWSVDLSGQCGGLGANARARAFLYDIDGDATVVNDDQARIWVAVHEHYIEGFGFLPNAPIDIWVNADPATQPPTEVWGTDRHGNFWWNASFAFANGDTMIVSDGVETAELMTIGPLSINADLDLLLADGQLPVGADVDVEMYGNACGAWQTVADGDDGSVDGFWSADLSGQCPVGLGFGAWARVFLHDAEGDATMVFPERPPTTRSSVTSNWVEGYDLAPNAPIEIWVNQNPAIDPPTATSATDFRGHFSTHPGPDLVFGDYVAVFDGALLREVVLTGPLTIDADFGAHTASGMLPVGAEVDVYLNGPYCGARVTVADGDDGSVDGFWSADLGGQCGDLGQPAHAQVMLDDGDGDFTVAEDFEEVLCRGAPVSVFIGNGESPTPGPDVILGTEGPDVIDGLEGDDIICGLGGDDVIAGGLGLDTIDGGEGIDDIDGGKHNDQIFGGPGNDILYGGGGGDRIWGDDGDDQLRGGLGNDRLYGGPGFDELRGQNGSDDVYANSATVFTTTDVDTVYGGGLYDDVWGDAGNDVVYGGNFADVLSGKSGDDYLYGNNGADTLRGGPHITGDYCNGGVHNSGSGDTASACETVINVP